jgi:aminoglycoside phosphotransferase (APT) family kinase protein
MEAPTIFDEALMRRVFEDSILPLCRGRRVILHTCRLLWSKYESQEGSSRAVYHVEFADQENGRHFKRQLYLVIPGESRLTPGMPEIGELPEGESAEENDLRISYLYLPHLKILIQVFPTDTKLPQLPVIVNPKAIAPYLQTYMNLKEPEVPRVTVLKYKPEKRCVVRYDFSDHGERSSSMIGKTHYNSRGRDVFHIMQFLRRSGLPVPAPLAYIADLKLLLIEALQGRELGSFVTEPDFPEHIKGAAAAVAGLHMIPLDRAIVQTASLHRVSLNEEADSFGRHVERFQLECPELKQIDSLASAILRKLKLCEGECLTFVHGELDPSQLFVSDSKIWVLDFDRFKISRPAIDIGHFLAYLNRVSLKIYGDPHRLDAMGTLFLDLYLSQYREDIRTPILLCKAMEFVKMSFLQFRRQNVDWKFRVASLWEMAEKTLSSV